MNTKEQIIRFLIIEYNNQKSNPIIIDKNDIHGLQLTEDEIVKILMTLNAEGLIIAEPRSPHKDFSLYWEIALNKECLKYFEFKKKNRIANRRDWIKTYIPITISFSALIISIISLLVSLYRLSHGM